MNLYNLPFVHMSRKQEEHPRDTRIDHVHGSRCPLHRAAAGELRKFEGANERAGHTGTLSSFLLHWYLVPGFLSALEPDDN